MIYVLLLGLPVLVFTVFGVSLIRFLCLRRRQKREPEGVDDALLRRLKLCAMVSGAIAGLFVLVIAAFAVMFTFAIAFM